jgi:hypothetical protein
MRTRYTTPWPILPLPVTKRHSPVQFACVSVYRTVDQWQISQWWPGVWGWTGPVGHGLDTMGRGWPRNLEGRGGMGGIRPVATGVRTSEICVKNHE